jgi:hypothetical protein
MADVGMDESLLGLLPIIFVVDGYWFRSKIIVDRSMDKQRDLVGDSVKPRVFGSVNGSIDCSVDGSVNFNNSLTFNGSKKHILSRWMVDSIVQSMLGSIRGTEANLMNNQLRLSWRIDV